MMASRMPLERSFERLRKKLTVIGMMGHTQGVQSATSPPKNPSMKIYHQAIWATLASSPPMSFSSLTTGVQRLFRNVESVGVVAISAETVMVSAATCVPSSAVASTAGTVSAAVFSSFLATSADGPSVPFLRTSSLPMVQAPLPQA